MRTKRPPASPCSRSSSPSPISAVLVGIGLPGLARMMSGWRLATAARQLVLELKVVRMQAVSENGDHRLRLAVPGSTLSA